MSAKTFLPLRILLWLVLPWNAGGQVVSAALEGVVRDPSGAAVAGANVVVRNAATNAEAHLTTGQDGFFLVPALPPGPYSVTVAAGGFKTLVSNTIVLVVDQKAQVQFVLEIGAVTQTVSVTAEAALLKRTTSDVGQVIDSREITELPLNARNSYALAFLGPGIHGDVTTAFNGFNMSVNGGRPGSTEILLDGIPSSPRAAVGINVFAVFPPVDATEEFKVQASNYSAQFGGAGSGIINMIYKSGTNHLHGDVYEFLRNSALDANSFFNNMRGIHLANFQRSQFGFTLGGPVVIPRIYNGHDKTFFFGDFEGLRQGAASNTVATVPTADMRRGNFSGLVTTVNNQTVPVTIYDPDTTMSQGSGYVRSAFPQNIIRSDRIDRVAAQILSYWPLPNLPGVVNNFAAAGKTVTNINNYDVKIDENANDQNRFFARFSRHNLTTLPPNYFPAAIQVAQGGSVNHEIGTDIAADYTHIFSSTFLTEARYGFARMYIQFRPRSFGFDPTQLGLPSYIVQNAQILAFPGIHPANYLALGNGGADYRNNAFENHAVSVNNTWIKHAHTLNFGFQLVVDQVNNFEANQAVGDYTFGRGLTQGPDPQKASQTAGDGFATFLLGIGSGSMTLHSKDVATTSRAYAVYLEDDWRLKPKLTLNLGLRYELQIPRTERYNRMNYFDPLAPSPLAAPSGLPDLKGGLVFVGTEGVGRLQFPIRWTNFAPRFGFAYQVRKTMVIRGGYGLFYYPAQALGASGTVGGFGYSSQTPFVGSLNGLTPPFTFLSDPFPKGLVYPPGNTQGLATLVGTSIQAPLRNAYVPYSENWTFGIQKQLPGSVLLDVAYVGSHGVRLTEGAEANFNLNQLTPATLALGNALTQNVTNRFYGLIPTGPLSSAMVPLSFLERPYPQFIDVDAQYPTGASSIYHSFQLKAERRVASGLTFLGSFTGEKLIDSYSIIQNEGRGVGIQNIYDLRAERSVSTNDISRLFSFAAVYELPVGRGHPFGSSWTGLRGALLGGWQLNGILTLQTGFPLALTTQNTSNSGSNVLRPNTNGQNAKLSGSTKSRLNEYFNTSVFSQPFPFTFGNTGRTLPNVRAPGVRNLDTSLFKNFRFAERFTVQFRAESFNALNQVQFGEPGQNFNDAANFGKIRTQTNSPRQLQFALKMLF